MTSSRRAAAAVALVLLASRLHAQSSAPIESYWTPNGNVYSMAELGGSVYLGGNFTRISPHTGNLARIDATTGVPDLPLPKVNGRVIAIAPDGTGGYYVGGTFTRVGDLPRNNLAHVLADGRVSAWNPGANTSVFVLALSGGTVYAGGLFTTIGGQARGRLAAVDAATGAVTGWNPNANSIVRTIVVAGPTVFVGGDFTSIGSPAQARGYAAEIDAATAAATAWNPNANSYVFTLVKTPTRVFLGGYFTTVGGQARNYIAAVNTTTGGLITTWNPNANDNVLALALSSTGTTLFAGGLFTTIGGGTRVCIAALDEATGVATGWNPGAGSWVYRLAVSGNTLYAGGFFGTLGGSTRNRLGALNATTGVPTAWDPGPNHDVYALAVSPGRVYAGGDFSMAGGVARGSLAAVDVATGAPTSWSPTATGGLGNVLSMAATPGAIYVGGNFTMVNGFARQLAALDPATGTLSGWNPNAGNQVLSLLPSGGWLYAGGAFTSIGGQVRNRIARLNTSSAAADPTWDPGADNWVNALAASGTTVYAGGLFLNAGGQPRNRAAGFGLSGGAATAWNPNASNTVNALASTPGALYVGGSFTTIGGLPRNRIARLDDTTGAADPAFNPGTDGQVRALAIAGGRLLVGGDFSSIGGQARIRAASLDAAGTPTSWDARATDVVNAIVPVGNRVFVGGSFFGLGGAPRRGFGAFCLVPNPTSLTATPAGGGAIDLAWAGSSPSYTVYRSRVAGGPYEPVGSSATLAFTDATVDGGVTYYYVVRGLDGCESDPSNEASAVTTGTCDLAPDFEGVVWGQELAAPTCAVRVGWGNATSPCGGTVLYSVYRDTSAAFTPSAANRILASHSGSTHTDATLQPATTYHYVVRATSVVTGQEDTNLIRLTAATTACTLGPPSPVTVLAVRATSGQTKIEWVNPATGSYGKTRIRRRSDAFPMNENDGTLVAEKTGGPGAPDSHSDGSLSNGTTYYYAAFVDNGGGVWSTARTATGRPFVTTGPVKWAYTTGASAMAPPGLDAFAVYAPSNDRMLHALVAGGSGGDWPTSPAWLPVQLGGEAQSRPPVVPTTRIPGASRVVFLGGQDGRVYAIDADHGGTPLWQSTVLGERVQAAPAGMFTAFGGAYDYILVGTWDASGGSRFHALDVATGAVVGTPFDNVSSGDASGPIGVISAGATVDYVGRRIFFTSRTRAGGSPNTLWCLDLTPTGLSFAWAAPFEDIDSAVNLRNGKLLVGNTQGDVIAVDPANGNEIWRFATADGPVKGFVTTTGTNLFFATTTKVWGLRDLGASADPLWPGPVTSVPSPSIVLSTGGPLLIVGGGNGRLYQLDTSSSPPTPTSVTLGDGLAAVGAPSLWRATGLVYVGSDAGIVYAVQLPLP